MGACSSLGSRSISAAEDHEEGKESAWKLLLNKKQAWEKYILDGTLTEKSPLNHLELRVLMDDPHAQRSLGQYAKAKKTLEIFMCWIDVQEFKGIPFHAHGYRRSKAVHLVKKYVEVGAILELGGISNDIKNRYVEKIQMAVAEEQVLEKTFMDEIQLLCFTDIFNNIFIPFTKTEKYQKLIDELKLKYNYVCQNDFEYMEKLGHGAFGLVVHCKKKSTGRHYAMKIQRKTGLLSCYYSDMNRVDYEKRALVSCQHPFIVSLKYAFQTPSLAVMVLELGTEGSLQEVLHDEKKLSEDRVCFYAAELILALSHIHRMGLIYRDLKPGNVLLHHDGHIQLVDLGGVVDLEGKTFNIKEDVNSTLAPLLFQEFREAHEMVEAKNVVDKEFSRSRRVFGTESKEEEAIQEHQAPKLKRALSIMGTMGYMAPEVVILMYESKTNKIGYTCLVDWWSLGVTMFRLLTGEKPFRQENIASFARMAREEGVSPEQVAADLESKKNQPMYAMLFASIEYPEDMSKDARNIVERLLDVDENSRLGAAGLQEIKKHEFFKTIDWNRLEQKLVIPPYMKSHTGRHVALQEAPIYSSFEVMMQDLDRGPWLNDCVHRLQQHYFKRWDYISPQTVRIEMGIANSMEQYDSNLKLRQLLGPVK